ncbi:murein L,D-transpeptidase family protein [Mesorhizobium sp. RMAD-H1]|uniref:L,D-transpeptidase family protein n=1 Tax=Mesorhizobium sp. RMAD-H1 TaxID=2587065 RepID=UPI001616779A|nr:murein L,D-transpeptidase family protein [Mesorhizobium sp. RMAD-H1]MBB2972500.1 murein L,D-transpeptidase YafK [Mesorhizobium sp. RMAD-H1]
MKLKNAFLASLMASALLAGCQGSSLDDISPKAEKPLPQKIVAKIKAKGMTTTSPIMIRIFKEEGQLEVWKRKDNGRYDVIATYDICKWSGKLGPKYIEGDRQAPEGFYTVRPAQMNPRSSYYLSFNIGFPNAYDRVNGRTGQHLMVHGACSSSGCYSMTDEQVAEIYAFARDAFRGGQTAFQIQAFPFRMTAANMARYRNDPNYPFWKMLKEGYDLFEITKVPPKVDVCEKRYVFNNTAIGPEGIAPDAACPTVGQPDALRMSYMSYQKTFETAFSTAQKKSSKQAPAPSIAGEAEAKLVAAWSAARARGEKVSREPPSLTPASAEKPNAPDIDPVMTAKTAPAAAQPAPQQAIAAAPQQQTPAEMPPVPAATPVPQPNPVAQAPAGDVAAGNPAGETPMASPMPEAVQAADAAAAGKPWWKVFGR